MNSKVAWQMADSSRKNWNIWLSRRALAWHTEPIIVFHGMIVHNRFYQKAMTKAVSSNISNHASIVLHDFSMYYTCVAVGESGVSESLSGARMVRGPCDNASSRRDGLWVIESSPCCKWWIFGRNQWIYCLHIPFLVCKGFVKGLLWRKMMENARKCRARVMMVLFDVVHRVWSRHEKMELGLFGSCCVQACQTWWGVPTGHLRVLEIHAGIEILDIDLLTLELGQRL